MPEVEDATPSRLSVRPFCRPALLAVAILLAYAALAVAFTYPLSFHAADHVMSQGTDANLFIWTIAWDAHAFVHQPLSIFDANIFYPFRHTLAYSENLIGSALLVAPVLWITGNPVLTMNVAALITIPLCAFGAFVLARKLDATIAGAVVAGLVYGFSSPRFFRLDQLHLTNVQWIPFSLAFAHAYFKERRRRDLRAAIAFFTLQALASGHGAVFLLLALALLVAYRLAFREPLDLVRRVRDVGVVGFVLLVPALLVVLPYRAAQLEMGLRRTLDNWHTSWTSFAAAPTHVDTWLAAALLPGVDVFNTASAYLFPGVLTVVLAIAGMLWRDERTIWWRRLAIALDYLFLFELAAALYGTLSGDPRVRIGGVVVASLRHPWRAWAWCIAAVAARLGIARRAPLLARPRLPRDHPALFYTLLFLLTLWLTIGPPYGVWQYVYWLPGFDFIRAPSRFMILAVLSLAVLAAFGFDALARRLHGAAYAAVAGSIVAAMALEFAAPPLPMTLQSPAIPPIDRWLASKPAPFVVAEVPVPDSANITIREEQESIYMLHSMAHWQKTVHGYSGLLPDFSDELYSQLTHFPDAVSLRRLQEVGVTYVVVHDPAIAARARAFSELSLEHEEAGGSVYRMSTKP